LMLLWFWAAGGSFGVATQRICYPEGGTGFRTAVFRS
jgi:hypothetical protein